MVVLLKWQVTLVYLEGDFLGENLVTAWFPVSNGDLILSSFVFWLIGELDLSESALLFVYTEVGVCGNCGSVGNDGKPESSCELRLFCNDAGMWDIADETAGGVGEDREGLVSFNCWSCKSCCCCCCCCVARIWCCNSWWNASVCCNIWESFSFVCGGWNPN